MEVVEKTVVKVEESQAEEEDDAAISRVFRCQYCSRTFYSSQALGGTKMLTEKREQPEETPRGLLLSTRIFYLLLRCRPLLRFSFKVHHCLCGESRVFPKPPYFRRFGSNGSHEFAGDNGVFPYRLSEDIDERSFGDWQRSLGRSSSFNSVDTSQQISLLKSDTQYLETRTNGAEKYQEFDLSLHL